MIGALVQGLQHLIGRWFITAHSIGCVSSLVGVYMRVKKLSQKARRRVSKLTRKSSRGQIDHLRGLVLSRGYTVNVGGYLPLIWVAPRQTLVKKVPAGVKESSGSYFVKV